MAAEHWMVREYWYEFVWQNWKLFRSKIIHPPNSQISTAVDRLKSECLSFRSQFHNQRLSNGFTISFTWWTFQIRGTCTTMGSNRPSIKFVSVDQYLCNSIPVSTLFDCDSQFHAVVCLPKISFLQKSQNHSQFFSLVNTVRVADLKSDSVSIEEIVNIPNFHVFDDLFVNRDQMIKMIKMLKMLDPNVEWNFRLHFLLPYLQIATINTNQQTLPNLSLHLYDSDNLTFFVLSSTFCSRFTAALR
jgi:hypothetical protein